MRRIVLMTAGAAGALALAGCGSGGLYGGSSAAGSSSGGASTAPAGASPALSTTSSPLGTVVVTGAGRAVYVFDKDTAGSGRSVCSGTCATLWPAVTTTSSAPAVQGVQGTIGTIPGAGGMRQLTLDGHPLYTYAGDSGSGKFTGQGVQGIWWLVSPSGSEVKQAPSPASSSGSSTVPPGY